ncbi:MAG: hypothetical protein H7338_19830 [Candidatus Sericytochromatia bacterium]|nr:hypothetical protein [Candidatus Sericytochromatia bacterium]
MANEISTVQSLKAVDAWIDVINANINGGVRTAFKSSRLKFAGSNINIGRAGNATSLPLQFPETGLITANTVIDFSQGAITSSTENTHLAVQGNGFFMVVSPNEINPAGGSIGVSLQTEFFCTRDGEFHTNAQGLLVNANGWYLVCGPDATTGVFGTANRRAVYNNVDNPATNATLTAACKLTDFLANNFVGAVSASGAALGVTAATCSLLKIKNLQQLKYTKFGSTVYDFGYVSGVRFFDPNVGIAGSTTADATILNKSLEASNASMTQSVPELSLAQKLFSALTKVLQISQTNTDAVLNLIR